MPDTQTPTTAVGQPVQQLYRPTASLRVMEQDVPVSSFTLFLATGGVPKLEVVIAPFHLQGSKGQIAYEPGIWAFAWRWQKLQEVARDKTKRQVTFTFNANGVEDDLQNFTLENWILTGAGISDVQARGSFKLKLDIMHPLYAFQEATAHLLGSGVQQGFDLRDVGKASNVYEALIACMDTYATKHNQANEARQSAGDTTAHDAGAAFIQDYNSMIDTLRNHLEWDPDWTGLGFPTGPFTTDLDSIIPLKVMDYVALLNNASSWDWLIRSFCSHWLLQVIPTFYAAKLRLRPFEPWQPYSMTLYDTDISHMEFPPVDPLQIKGVMGYVDAPDSTGALSYVMFPKGDAQTKQEVVRHDETALTGSVLSLVIPAWMMVAHEPRRG
jgi:hypothetical protein